MSTLLLAMLLAADPADAPKGHLIPVGGGNMSEALCKRIIDVAGGPGVKMLIIPQSSESADAGAGSMKAWSQRGVKDISILDLTDVKAAEAAVNAAGFIWIGGGDQNRLMKAVAGTNIPDAIRKRYQTGATVAGTSAGAAVISDIMITGKADLNAIIRGRTETAQGLALWPGVIVDQHFVKRARFNRLLSAVMDHPEVVGVGIDEGTGVIVTGNKAEVIGASQVVVVDARKAEVRTGKKDDAHGAKGVVVSVYNAGGTFGWK